MARPKVFVSSTFYDLKQIRSDLERFIKDMGYDPILHERGAVPYGSKEKLEQYCYREIRQVELLVSIIGGRFGSQSEQHPYSISQQELKTAYELGVQVFIFVEAAVLGEYQTFLKNKDVAGITFSYVDNIGIYQFLEELHSLPNNNQITPFGSAQDIVTFLREQWAGMFQRFLQDQGRSREVQILKDLQANMHTLNQLVTYLTKEKQNSDESVREILRSSHPVFAQLRKVLNVPYRIFFTSRNELSVWLELALNYQQVDHIPWESSNFTEWILNDPVGPDRLLKVSSQIFNEKGDLVIYTPQQWNDEWVSLHVSLHVIDYAHLEIKDEDIPF